MYGKEDQSPRKDDLLVGAKAAADYIGVPPRAVYHLVETGFLPVIKVGEAKNARLFFRKSEVDAAFRSEAA